MILRGSSPRMWGISTLHVYVDDCLRFIPTHVGHICITLLQFGSMTVHPHACGAYCITDIQKICLFGSSPRMWGIFHCTRSTIFSFWFIPTHVGHIPAISARQPAHPGSSPRMWGIWFAVNILFCFSRFIPTHVGHILGKIPK